MDLMKMIAKNGPILKQGFTEFALPCLVSMACLVELPPLVVKEGEAAEIASVAVLHLTSTACLCLLIFCRDGIAELRLGVLDQMHLCVFL